MAIDTTLLESLIAATPTPGGYWTKARLEELLDNLNDLEDQIGSATATVVTDGVTITGDGTATAALTVALPLPAVTSANNSMVLTVDSATWTAKTPASGLPAITSSTDTLVLTVVSGATTATWSLGTPGPTGATGATGAAGGFSSVQTISEITANYTLQLTDAGKLLKPTAAAQIRVPLNSAVAFDVGQHIDIIKYTTAAVTVAVVTSGVTLRLPYGGKVKTLYGSATLVKTATDEWALIGDCEAI
jgi:hypothetical protein